MHKVELSAFFGLWKVSASEFPRRNWKRIPVQMAKQKKRNGGSSSKGNTSWIIWLDAYTLERIKISYISYLIYLIVQLVNLYIHMYMHSSIHAVVRTFQVNIK